MELLGRSPRARALPAVSPKTMRPVIELTSILLIHRMTSLQWLKHLKSALVALEDVEEVNVGYACPR